MASGGLDYRMEDLRVYAFNSLSDEEKANLPVGHEVIGTYAAVGAKCSIYVLRGIFSEAVIGRFEAYIGAINGTVIGFKAGCIVMKFTSWLPLSMVVAFIVGALAGGIICVMTALKEIIFSSIPKMWNALMGKNKSYTEEQEEKVGEAFSKVIIACHKGYNTVCTMVDKVRGAMAGMSIEQRRTISERIVAAIQQFETAVDQALEIFMRELNEIVAGIGAQSGFNDAMREIRRIRDENSRVLNEAIHNVEAIA